MELTQEEIVDLLDVKCIAVGSTNGYTLLPSIYEITDKNLMWKSLLLKDEKVNITIDDFRLGSNLTLSETIGSIKNRFLNTKFCFTQSHFWVLNDTEGFIQLFHGWYESDKHLKIKGVDKIHLKYECNNRSIVNDIRESIL